MKRATLVLATAGTMLLMACGAVLAAQVISCQAGKACNGTANSDTMQGSGGDDRIFGRAGLDSISGNLGSDAISGEQSADRVRGGYGPDNLLGGSGNDVLNGDSSNDRITGGPGKDTVNGGPGNDTVFAADGQLDSISCGLGSEDVAFVDAADMDAEGTDMQDFVRLTSCETINEPPVEPPPPAPAAN